MTRFLIRSVLVAGAVIAVSAFGSRAQAIELPPGYAESQVVGNILYPTALQFAPDGRLFVSQQQGQLRIIKNGVLLKKPFVTLQVNSSGEHGLQGIAFDPEFQTNGFVYIYYTAKTPAVHHRVSRFTADGDLAVPGSEVVLLDLPNTDDSVFHSAGGMAFGPDGKLYIGVGDNANRKNAQRLSNPFGKVLRMEKDGSVPADNPFATQASGVGRFIWSYGFRNPFTLDFQEGTGRLFINDVGADSWEEINEGVRGGNYGWPVSEGGTSEAAFRSPLYTYPHGSEGEKGQGCAITGGGFYQPKAGAFPGSYVGNYFYMDYCQNWIRVLDLATGQSLPFARGIAPNSLGLKVGPDGALYYVSQWLGGVFKISYTGAP